MRTAFFVLCGGLVLILALAGCEPTPEGESDISYPHEYRLTIEVQPKTAPANGVSAVLLTLTLTNVHGQLVPHETVVLTKTLGFFLDSQGNLLTDQSVLPVTITNGFATVGLQAPNRPGTSIITGKLYDVEATATVPFY
jgi:hypothetical protein